MAHQPHQWHPAPPQYGTSSFQYPPQAQTPGQQQFQYNPSAPSPSIRQQYAYPSSLNQARFDANSQVASPNSNPPQYSPAGFNPALFHQFGGPNLLPPPPPSFPPIPLPNGTFPPFIPPPQPSHNFQNQYSSHGQATRAHMPAQQYRKVEQPSFHMEQTNMLQTVVHKRMDVHDQEMKDIQDRAATMGTHSSGQDNIADHRGALQRQKADIAIAAPSDRTDSVSSYNPPSATPPESGETPSEPSNGQRPADLQAGEATKYQGRGTFEMRELAKGALLSLAPHNIKFSDLLAEGIDAQLLSQLFEEVGLKTTPSATVKPTIQPKPTSTPPAVGPNAAQSTASKASGVTPTASDAPPLTGVGEPSVVAVSSTPASGRPVRQQAGSLGNIALAATKAVDITSLASPTMERKDVIAAMLAAKMGKPIPRKDSPSMASPDLPAKPTQLASAGINSIASPSQPKQPIQPVVSAPTSQAAGEEPENKLTPKPRSMAKTELVVQKLEQLKRETAAKTQATEAIQELHSLSQSPIASRSTSGLANGLSTYSQASLPPKPVSQEVVMSNTQTSLLTPYMGIPSAFSSAPPSSATFTSSIPGLFMMDADRDSDLVPAPKHQSTEVMNGFGQNTLNGVTNIARAQRPIAVDIDIDTVSRKASSSRISFKRPLAVNGFDDEDPPPAKMQDIRHISSRENDSIISDRYSDDISEGEIMEIDDGSPVSPLPRAPSHRSFPISSDAGAAWPAGTHHTSPITQRCDTAAGSGLTEAVYSPGFNGQRTVASSKRQLELETTRKKLADAEDRRKAKQNAFSVHSLSTSPMSQVLTSASLSTVGIISEDGRGRQQFPHPSPAQNKQSFSNTSESKSPKAAAPIDPMQRAKELREKLLRQRMLKNGLPELDKEVQKTQSRQIEAQARLAQLRREAEQREEEAREARKREQEYLEEVKRLEEQLEMGVNGQQQFSQEMDTLDQEISPQTVQSPAQESEPQPAFNSASSIATTTADPVLGNTALSTFPHDTNGMTPIQEELSESGASGPEGRPISHEHDNRLVRPSAPAAFSTAEEAVILEPHTTDQSASEEEGFISQDDDDHHDEVDVSPQDQDTSDSDDSPMEVDSDTDGSASMSDSGSEDYQPAEPITTTGILEPVRDEDEDEEYDPMDAPVSGAQPSDFEEGQDEYEPSEVVEPLEVQTTQLATGSSISHGTASEDEPEHGDDREHGLELTEANTLTNPQEMLPSVPDAADTNNAPRAHEPTASHFTPYKSALSDFKSYRFNRQFTDRVPHGYRSLTYSNIIDPAKPLCSTEAQGGICNDVDCEEQHFKQMSLADEKILVQMSSAHDMPDKAARDRFLAGLKLVIADLSAKQISDFDTVASELAAYRRRFRQEQDPSLVSALNENENEL